MPAANQAVSRVLYTHPLLECSQQLSERGALSPGSRGAVAETDSEARQLLGGMWEAAKKGPLGESLTHAHTHACTHMHTHAHTQAEGAEGRHFFLQSPSSRRSPFPHDQVNRLLSLPWSSCPSLPEPPAFYVSDRSSLLKAWPPPKQEY